MNSNNVGTIKQIALRGAIALTGLLVLTVSPAAFGQIQCWTTVGSAGTVDEVDLGLQLLNLENATLKGNATGTLNIRYNIVAVDGLFVGPGDNIAMAVRYNDNGANARVVVRLKEANINNGVITTKLTFDSNVFAQVPGAQTQSVATPCTGGFFDFENNAYFLDVEITKTNNTGTPILRSVNVCGEQCG